MLGSDITTGRQRGGAGQIVDLNMECRVKDGLSICVVLKLFNGLRNGVSHSLGRSFRSVDDLVIAAAQSILGHNYGKEYGDTDYWQQDPNNKWISEYR